MIPRCERYHRIRNLDPDSGKDAAQPYQLVLTEKECHGGGGLALSADLQNKFVGLKVDTALTSLPKEYVIRIQRQVPDVRAIIHFPNDSQGRVVHPGECQNVQMYLTRHGLIREQDILIQTRNCSK